MAELTFVEWVGFALVVWVGGRRVVRRRRERMEREAFGGVGHIGMGG